MGSEDTSGASERLNMSLCLGLVYWAVTGLIRVLTTRDERLGEGSVRYQWKQRSDLTRFLDTTQISQPPVTAIPLRPLAALQLLIHLVTATDRLGGGVVVPTRARSLSKVVTLPAAKT